MKKILRTINRKVSLIILFAFLSSVLSAQTNCDYKPPRQAENWVFGNSATINFSNGDAVSAPSPFNMLLPNGIAAISDRNGNLKLFTDGITLRNGAYYTVPGGADLNGNNFASQTLIVPQPGSSRYYVFTLDMYIPPVFTDGINYTIVDAPGGSPASIVSKNNLLLTENAQKIAGVQHANGYDYWVVVHGFGDNKGSNFYSYLVSDTGLVANPVISAVGHPHNGPINSNNGGGSMKISPDGSKLALVIPDDGIVEVFDFDRSTGKPSNPKSSTPGQFNLANGIEFSPDNSKLYFTTTPLGDVKTQLFQLDLSLSDPFASPFVVNEFDVHQGQANDTIMAGLQLASDGKIYVAKFKTSATEHPYLGVVYNPNRPQAACNYNELDHNANNGLYLNGGNSLLGLPNFVSSFVDIPHYYAQNMCLKDTTQITLRNRANIDNANWDFGDANGFQAIADEFAPGFVYGQAGDYTVSLTEEYGSEQYNFSESIRIHDLPAVSLAGGTDTLYILENSAVQLDAGDWDFYQWSPGGSTDRYLDINNEGLYSVMVTDSNCCKNSDSVYVKYAKINFPNAFNPKSNITTNAEFKIVGEFGGFKSYKMNIFNRWGQLIFESSDPTEGWDGSYKGEAMPAGTYVYSATFESYESSVQASLTVKKKGTVTLLR